jgi:hypothetical protein
LLAIYYAALDSHLAILTEIQTLRHELLSFLDCNGVPLNQQGRFHLPRVPPDILQDIVKDWMDDYFPSFVDIEPTVPPDFDVGSNPTLDENGKFKLPTVDPALIDWFLPKYAPSPTR